jgi:hypothetical protein
LLDKKAFDQLFFLILVCFVSLVSLVNDVWLALWNPTEAGAKVLMVNS